MYLRKELIEFGHLNSNPNKVSQRIFTYDGTAKISEPLNFFYRRENVSVGRAGRGRRRRRRRCCPAPNLHRTGVETR